MNKDIEWANREIKKVRDLLNNKRYEEEVDDFTTGVLSGLKQALNILDQLDELEVLSQDWIDKHEEQDEYIGYAGVPVDDLQNLLVPKQDKITEEQVAEYLRERSMMAVDSELVYREKLDNKIVIEMSLDNLLLLIA